MLVPKDEEAHALSEPRAIRFKQADIARAAKGLHSAGIFSFKINIDPRGNITILTGEGTEKIGGPNEWNEVFQK
jgi:hypothetical protein